MSYLEELFGLDQLRAVVTGGSSGIGRGIATALARAGAQVHLVARDAGKLRTVAEEIGATWDACDLADSRALADLCRDEHMLAADILVTCAGVNHRPPLASTSEDEYVETMRVNLEAPYRLGQACGPRMAGRGFGRIINVGSQQSWSAFGNSGVYGMTKAGVAGLSRSQAEAWGADGVTANTLVPGFVVTPMTMPTVAEPGRAEALAARSLLGRNGLSDDFSGAVVFLASKASSYVTGQMIAVDGGFSVH